MPSVDATAENAPISTVSAAQCIFCSPIPPGVATTHPGPRPDPDSRPRRLSAVLSPKVFSRHLDWLAVVYVRQSSARQVLESRESTALQYRRRASKLFARFLRLNDG
jgi:hypothetical protein